jgi:hypothetical protein
MTIAGFRSTPVTASLFSAAAEVETPLPFQGSKILLAPPLAAISVAHFANGLENPA